MYEQLNMAYGMTYIMSYRMVYGNFLENSLEKSVILNDLNAAKRSYLRNLSVQISPHDETFVTFSVMILQGI